MIIITMKKMGPLVLIYVSFNFSNRSLVPRFAQTEDFSHLSLVKILQNLAKSFFVLTAPLYQVHPADEC